MGYRRGARWTRGGEGAKGLLPYMRERGYGNVFVEESGRGIARKLREKRGEENGLSETPAGF